MRSRTELIRDIATYGPDYLVSRKEIRKYPWDCEEELYHLSRADVLSVLEKYLAKEIDEEQLCHWATFLECRDDLGYEAGAEEALGHVIFLLANPELTTLLQMSLSWN